LSDRIYSLKLHLIAYVLIDTGYSVKIKIMPGLPPKTSRRNPANGMTVSKRKDKEVGKWRSINAAIEISGKLL
jgi:hypothetical protein